MSIATAAPELIRVKERFQVTIPSTLRKQMNISEGDYMEVRYLDGEIRIKPRAEVVGIVSGADWYKNYCARYPENKLTQSLTDADVSRMVKELR